MQRNVVQGAAYALLCTIWGSTWFAIKVGLESTPVFFAASLRFAVAAAVLAGLLVVLGAHLPRTRAEWNLALFAGIVLFTADYGLIYWAEGNGVPSGLTAVLFATMPLQTAIAAHALIEEEPFTRQKMAGIGLGFAGILLIFRTQLSLSGWGLFLPMLAVLLSATCAGVVTAAERRWGREVDPIGFNVVAMAIGSTCLASISLVTGEAWSVPPWPAGLGAVLYLSLAGSVVAFVAWNWMLRTVSATSMSFVTMITPIVALVLGAAVANEGFQPLDIAGAGVVILGIYLSGARRLGAWTRRARPREASSVPESKR